MSAELYPRGPRSGRDPRMQSRPVFGAPGDHPRSTPVIIEWELRGAQWTDTHPHDEFNYVLEGELHVESDGHTVIATAGDMIRVVAGSTGRYFAPEHARMLAIYDHNPTGDTTHVAGVASIQPSAEPSDPADEARQ